MIVLYIALSLVTGTFLICMLPCKQAETIHNFGKLLFSLTNYSLFKLFERY